MSVGSRRDVCHPVRRLFRAPRRALSLPFRDALDEQPRRLRVAEQVRGGFAVVVQDVNGVGVRFDQKLESRVRGGTGASAGGDVEGDPTVRVRHPRPLWERRDRLPDDR